MNAHLVFCIDKNFAQHLGVLLHSLQVTNPTDSFHFHVLTSALDCECSELLLTGVGPQHQLSFYQVDEQSIATLPISEAFADRLSLTTYYRLLLPNLLPAEVNKVLYLDADMMVCDDISSLFAVDLSRVAAAVVEDVSRSTPEHMDSIGMQRCKYFNAGMILINMQLWRHYRVSERCFSLLSTRRNWPCNDQDVLNVALEGLCTFVPAIWNWQLINHQAATESAVIVHFNGAEKPWHYSCQQPFTAEYRRYKATSVYADNPLEFGLDQHDQQLIEQIKKRRPRTLVIYGAGIKGRRLAAFIQLNLVDIEILAMIDRAPQFETFRHVPVICAESYNGTDTILIASKAYAAEISQQLKARDYTDIICVESVTS